jgi:uncharacterized RDD family membrane protein YckC
MYIAIQTAHNVTIEYAIASVADRILAVLVDGLVQLAYIFLLIYLLSYLENHHLINAPTWLFIVVVYMPVLFYELLSEIMLEGQTLGKKALNIKVIQLDGSQPPMSSFIVRWLIRGCCCPYCSFYLSKGAKAGRCGSQYHRCKTKSSTAYQKTKYFGDRGQR